MNGYDRNESKIHFFHEKMHKKQRSNHGLIDLKKSNQRF